MMNSHFESISTKDGYVAGWMVCR